MIAEHLITEYWSEDAYLQVNKFKNTNLPVEWELNKASKDSQKLVIVRTSGDPEIVISQ